MMTINTTIDTPFALPPSIIHPLLLSAQTLYLDPSVLLQTLIEPFLQTIPLALTNTLAALSRSRASAEGMRARSLGEEGWVGDVLEGYQDVMSAWARCLGGERGKAVVREDRILGKEFKEQIIESLNPPSPLPSPVLSRLPSFDRTSSIDRASSPTPSDSSASSITSVQTTTPTSYRLQRQHTTNRDKESGNEAGKGKGKGRAKAGTVKSRWNGLDSGVEGLSGDESYEEEQNLEKVHLSTAQKIPFSSTSSSATNPITDKLAHEESRQDEGRTSYTSTSFGSKLVLLQKFLQPRSSSSPLPETLPASPMRHSLSKQSSTDLMNPNSYLLIFLRAIKSSFKAGLFLWIIWHIIYRVRAGWFRPSSVPSMTSAGGGVVSGVGRAEEIRRRLRRGILARF
ncbi:hypothetical protein [Phaffia rhodozyma]|uniref:Uncharacterized protein n=1 Tax=Phaffia rhodozyma TaxID=264483 RepID=A0A0F7STZ8_PHARH|nr:hypothetical protein [Phaffia rhodozyma]